MDRLSSLSAFVNAVDLGGFAPAARHLRLSPAMIGKHVASLEGQLGTRLLHRTTRRLTLTEAGQLFYERAILILRAYEEATRATASFQESPQGLLRITTPIAFAELIGEALGDFARAYPQVRLNVTCDDRVLDLAEHRFDLALRAGKLADSSLIARKLALIPVVVCASPRYIEQHGAPMALEELTRHECIAYEYQRSGENWAFADGAGEILVPLTNTTYRSNNLSIQRALVLAGHGIAQLPRIAVEEDLAKGTLVPLLEHVPTIERWLSAVYAPGYKVPLAVRVLIDFLAKRFEPMREGRPQRSLEEA
ncbi:LysR family transcriptional regulator [Pseudomonas sp. PGPR40]|uniref:LysR family transcriptional regulator n=1 Tax=Pseudomonas sp. PGPR40 TaxID=2913476 RepID=UPI001EDB07AD|nr:LysR family transcriptional regulator [Pseudomonas sp. PGPR40]